MARSKLKIRNVKAQEAKASKLYNQNFVKREREAASSRLKPKGGCVFKL
jgi:hypothetical protein